MFDLCIETYGAVAHVVDSALPTLYLGRNRRRQRPDHRRQFAEPGLAQPGPDFAPRVRSAVEDLSYPQVEALWLVDVCGLSYDQAAAHSRISRDALSSRVRQARREIRDSLPA